MAGLGIREIDQLTLESVAALRRAGLVLCVPTTGDGALERLRELGAKRVEDLRPLYRDGAVDLDNYKALFRRVVSACRQHEEVCVLLPGHPRVGVTITHWLEQARDRLRLRLRVLEGISSFGALINELTIDPLENGAAMLDANRVLRLDQPLSPLIDTFIYHVCAGGVRRRICRIPRGETGWICCRPNWRCITRPRTPSIW